MTQLMELRRRTRHDTSTRLAHGLMTGESRSRFRGAGTNFEESRPYLPGDDVRHIDWRNSARRGETHTRVFNNEREISCYVVTDQRTPMFFGSGALFKSVAAAQIGASLAWQAVANGDPVGGIVMDSDPPIWHQARRGLPHVVRLLRSIHRANQALADSTDRESSLGETLLLLRSRTRLGARVFIISDWHDHDASTRLQLFALGQRCRLVMIHVVDPLEQNMNVRGRLGVGDGHETTQFHATRRFRSLYQTQQTAWLADLKETASQAQAQLLSVSANDGSAAIIDRLTWR